MSDKFLDRLYKQVTKLNTAVDNYTKIGKIPAIPYRAFVNLADYLFVTGCVEQSEELLKSAIDFVSKSSDAYNNLGVLKQSTGDVEQALEYYEKSYKKDPSNVKTLCLWGNCLSMLGKEEEAIEKYKEAIEIDKKYANSYLFWGTVLIKQKKLEEAREKLELAIEYNDMDSRSLFMLASVEIELGLYDDALDKLEFLSIHTDNNHAAFHNIAYIFFKKKDYNKTIYYARKAIEHAPFKLETYLLLGDTYVLVDKKEDALFIYDIAEKNKLKSMFLYLSWGSTLQDIGDYEQAIEKFKKGIECENSVNDEIYAKLSKCYLKVKDIENARTYALKATEISNKNHIAQDVLADINMMENNFDEAIERLNIVSNNSSSKSSAYYKLAVCYKNKLDYQNSNKWFEKAIEYDSQNNKVLYDYIYSLNEQKDYDKALKKLITLEKNANDELEILELIFSVNYNIAKGDIYGYNGRKAIKIAEKIKDKYPDNFRFEKELNELSNISRE